MRSTGPAVDRVSGVPQQETRAPQQLSSRFAHRGAAAASLTRALTHRVDQQASALPLEVPNLGDRQLHFFTQMPLGRGEALLLELGSHG
jgi:hypothetical protein